MNSQDILKNLRKGFMFFWNLGKRLVQFITMLKQTKQLEGKPSCSGVPPSPQELQASQELSSLLKPSSVEFPYQTDPLFPEDVNKWGCALLCIAKIAYEELGFTPGSKEEIVKRVLAVRQVGIREGYLDEELTILDYNKVFLLFGLIVMYTDKHEPVYLMCDDKEREMLYMEFDGQGHFVCGDGRSQVKWDPYSKKGSRTAKYGRVVNKRIFEVKGWVA